MASVTGGVTPVYAAPETFDGWVSRFCDQYSLAIVYQELLTGQRPFNGTNVRQLIMQRGIANMSVIGPAPCPVERINNRWRDRAECFNGFWLLFWGALSRHSFGRITRLKSIGLYIPCIQNTRRRQQNGTKKRRL